MINVNVSIKNIVHVKMIIVGILAHLFVSTVSTLKVLLMIQ